MEIIRFADSKSRPWLNGEGSTRFLLDDDTGNGWTYRVSVADLTGSQAFSRLHGVHRHLLFLGPGRLRLNVNGDSKVVSLFECVQFEGEDAVVSEPSKSPARDLNVMIRRDAGTARILQTTRLNIVLQPSPGRRAAFLIALESGCVVAGQHLQPLDVAILPSGQTTQADGRVVLVQIDRSG